MSRLYSPKIEYERESFFLKRVFQVGAINFMTITAEVATSKFVSFWLDKFYIDQLCNARYFF